MLTRTGLFRPLGRRRRAGDGLSDRRPDQTRNADAFAVTRAACELVGWRYEVAGSSVPVEVGNVR